MSEQDEVVEFDFTEPEQCIEKLSQVPLDAQRQVLLVVASGLFRCRVSPPPIWRIKDRAKNRRRIHNYTAITDAIVENLEAAGK